MIRNMTYNLEILCCSLILYYDVCMDWNVGNNFLSTKKLKYSFLDRSNRFEIFYHHFVMKKHWGIQIKISPYENTAYRPYSFWKFILKLNKPIESLIGQKLSLLFGALGLALLLWIFSKNEKHRNFQKFFPIKRVDYSYTNVYTICYHVSLLINKCLIA